MCVGSDTTPKGVVSADAYTGENVEEKSSGLHPGGTFQSKNMSWRQEEPSWSGNWPASPNQSWLVADPPEGAVRERSAETSGG